MKPALAMPIAAALCLAGTGYAAFQHNQAKGSAADSALIAGATIGEAKQEAEKIRVHYLTVVAKEVNVEKVPEVVFNKDGLLERGNPGVISSNQFFEAGDLNTDRFVVSSIGVRNWYTGEYAAIEEKGSEGKQQTKKNFVIKHVFTKAEVQAKLNQVRLERGKQ